MAAESSGFFNAEYDGVSNVWDRVYTANQFADYFSRFISNGVYGGVLSELKVYQYTDEEATMQLRITPGMAYINGYWYCLEDTKYITVATASAISQRIDMIVVRYDINNRKITIEYVPNASKPVRNDEFYDLMICKITVQPNVTVIQGSDIEDTRLNKSVCGIVTGLIEQVDTTNLYNQLSNYLQEFKHNEEVDWEQWYTNEKQEMGEWFATNEEIFTNWSIASKKAYEDWFNSLRYILDGDVAGHLQNEIDEIVEKEFKRLYELDSTTIKFFKDGLGNTTQIVKENSEGVVTSGFVLDDMGNTVEIITTIVPSTGVWKYIKTMIFTDDDIVTSYEKEAK